MCRPLKVAICVSMGSMWPLALPAHHSFVSHYDPTRSVELRGTVVDFSFRSPHSFLYLDAASPNGERLTWETVIGPIASHESDGSGERSDQPSRAYPCSTGCWKRAQCVPSFAERSKTVALMHFLLVREARGTVISD